MLGQLIAAQDRQNELMEELIEQMGTAQRQRSAELGQWKQSNPELAHNCREAAETLGRVQTRFLENVTEEINDNSDCLMDGDFMLNEFVDRFGPRLAHLNGVLQVLSQLGSASQGD
jgi:predicted DsbA family dithiol-disulfide isomerase